MRILALIALLAWSAGTFAKESCDPDDIGLSADIIHPANLFYVGTCNYRNQDYEKAAELWYQLLDLENIDPEYHELQVSAYNNLGYLLFFGLGLDEDKTAAIDYWYRAISLGSTESEYHLCHAYADAEVSTYDPLKAKLHCEKAELIYSGIENRSEAEETILGLIRDYRDQLAE